MGCQQRQEKNLKNLMFWGWAERSCAKTVYEHLTTDCDESKNNRVNQSNLKAQELDLGIKMPPQLERFQRSGQNSALNHLEVERAGEAHRLEAIDSIRDFLRFIDGTNRAEISSREFAHVACVNRRPPDPRGACVRTTGPQRFWFRGLTLIFGLAAKTETD
jgi:hypothetical protein